MKRSKLSEKLRILPILTGVIVSTSLVFALFSSPALPESSLAAPVMDAVNASNGASAEETQNIAMWTGLRNELLKSLKEENEKLDKAKSTLAQDQQKLTQLQTNAAANPMMASTLQGPIFTTTQAINYDQKEIDTSKANIDDYTTRLNNVNDQISQHSSGLQAATDTADSANKTLAALTSQAGDSNGAGIKPEGDGPVAQGGAGHEVAEGGKTLLEKSGEVAVEKGGELGAKVAGGGAKMLAKSEIIGEALGSRVGPVAEIAAGVFSGEVLPGIGGAATLAGEVMEGPVVAYTVFMGTAQNPASDYVYDDQQVGYDEIAKAAAQYPNDATLQNYKNQTTGVSAGSTDWSEYNKMVNNTRSLSATYQAQDTENYWQNRMDTHTMPDQLVN